MPKAKIIWTQVDEAPALASYSLLPIIRAFTEAADIAVETRDISLAGRIIATFPENLTPAQRIGDELGELGRLADTAQANIIKLPNISASIPQLKAAIKELQSQGYRIPDYPDKPVTDAEKAIQLRFGKVLGSTVNPVLRQGNADRRAAAAVKQFARSHPHRMGAWEAKSRSHVAHMTSGDFYGSEKSVSVSQPCDVRIEFLPQQGAPVVLRDHISLQAGEIIDAAVMSCRALRTFYARQIDAAREEGVLLSLHLKATMMKISDPIMFGHAVSVFFKDVFEKHADVIKALGVNPNNGFGDLLSKIAGLPEAQRAAIEADIQTCFKDRPPLAMVNAAKGITNLHVPNAVIVDASMPAMIRESGRMWGADGHLHDTKALIPDRCYAGLYQVVIDDCKHFGAFDPRAMGSVSNVGLMAQKAEEYGSHDKTFEIAGKGLVRVLGSDGSILLEQAVETGDIFRMCQVKDAPIRDWVKLAVGRARATGAPAIFWLDPDRAHDRQMIAKVECYLKDHDTTGLDISIQSPQDAMRVSLQRIRAGKDTLSVTGNVLRDYLTDLFPILELGTSAKMLSIVPLMAGGGLFETGAGGTAPMLVHQFLDDGNLRWDSLGEFQALGAALEHIGQAFDLPRSQLLAETLDQAVGNILAHHRSPSGVAGELDTRGSHFYLALYWAQALAAQTLDLGLQTRFSRLATALADNEATICAELIAAQSQPRDLGGYYHPDVERVSGVMRPSLLLNRALAALQAKPGRETYN